MMNDSNFYIRSDIENFFTNIPTIKVLKKISNVMPDEEFNSLLKDAVKVELENLSELGEKKSLFPIYEIGVAQGCCLSPLIGNILLYEFDKKMNGVGITCLRYIDDFIVLGSTQSKVKAAFRSAQNFLKNLGLCAYDPFKNPKKAKFGNTRECFEFLGCEILPGFIRPTKKARKSLLKKIDEIIKESTKHMHIMKSHKYKNHSLIKTLTDISNLIMGWGNQYSFCNDMFVMKELDEAIDKRLKNYFQRFNEVKGKIQHEPINFRRLLGVQLLIDVQPKSII
jgi:hypothetical protein